MLQSLIKRFKNNYLSRAVIFTMDIILSILASVLVLFIVDSILGHFHISPVAGVRAKLSYLVLAAAASAVSFAIFRPYRIIIRRLSSKDHLVFAAAAGLKGVLVLAVVIPFTSFFGTNILLAGIDAMVTFALLVSVRLMMIIVWEHFNSRIQEKYQYKRVVVYGTSDKSVASIVRLQNSPHYKVIGFLDPDADGRTIEGLPVFSPKDDDEMEKTLIQSRADALLFPTDREAQGEENRLIRFATQKGIQCLIIPTVDEVVEGEAILRPREIKVEDLLGREEIKISLDAIEDNFRGKTVLVTGAAGSIGSELCRQLAGFGIGRLILFDNAETPMHNLRLELEDRFPELDFVPIIGDVRHPERLDFAFRTYHPHTVFHAAAYKHVPLMEENPCEAVLVNVYGTRNVADKCLEYEVESMVMISTDKAVNPTTIMGCTKRLAEIYVQSLGLATSAGKAGNAATTRFVTTRFGNVLGSNGSVIPRFKEQIAKGGPVTVTHPDINRFFMTIPEACRLVMEAATMSEGNQICVFDMGTPVKIDDLARRMIRLAGFEPDKDIRIEYTGLRPGEKLYEEVLADEENTLPSFHPRIRIAKVREYDLKDVDGILLRMVKMARDVDIPAMVELMKATVPEYQCKTDFSRRAAGGRTDKNETK